MLEAELTDTQRLIMSGDYDIPILTGQPEKKASEETKRRLTPAELDQKALAGFLDRAREFLASDTYWMHVLTMPGGRTKRKQVAAAFSKLMVTIPHIEQTRPNRAARRAFIKTLPREVVKASGVKASDLD